MTNKNFVDQEIMQLINTGRVKEVEIFPYIVNSLSLSKNSDNLTLKLDLRHVNIHMHKDKIKVEDRGDMSNYVK